MTNLPTGGQAAARVAIIGCGRISGHHCASIAQTRGAEVVALCDMDLAKAEAYAIEYGAKAYQGYHEMLADSPEINTVAIVTPSGMHYEHAMDVIKGYGKSLIIEKPTFLRPSHVEDVYKEAASQSLDVFPVFQNRYNKAVQRIKQGLDSGELGQIRLLSVRVRWCRPQRYYDLAPWRGTYAMDGGCLTNQGIHHVDLMRYFGGAVARLCAKMGTLGADIEVEDAAVGSTLFQNGALGTLEVTTAARPNDYEATLSLVCENGLAQVGGIAVNQLEVYTPEPAACAASSEDFSSNVYGHGHEFLYRDIVAHYEGERQFPVTRDDALETIRLLNAFYVADEIDGWVDVATCGDSARLGRVDEELAKLYQKF